MPPITPTPALFTTTCTFLNLSIVSTAAFSKPARSVTSRFTAWTRSPAALQITHRLVEMRLGAIGDDDLHARVRERAGDAEADAAVAAGDEGDLAFDVFHRAAEWSGQLPEAASAAAVRRPGMSAADVPAAAQSARHRESDDASHPHP